MPTLASPRPLVPLLALALAVPFASVTGTAEDAPDLREWNVLHAYLTTGGTVGGHARGHAHASYGEARDVEEIVVESPGVHEKLGRAGLDDLPSRVPDPSGAIPDAGPCVHEDCHNAVVLTHIRWHLQRSAQQDSISRFTTLPTAPHPDADPYGEEWLRFHRRIVREYDAWRLSNGYPTIPKWDPAKPYPTGFDLPSGFPARNASWTGVPIPSWATVAGGIEPDPVYGYTRLAEFPTANRLGKSLDFSWHLGVHGRVGGTMEDIGPAPDDPLFWAFHKFIEQEVFARWESIRHAQLTLFDLIVPLQAEPILPGVPP